MNLDSWLASHPYLEPLADFHAQIDSVLARVPDANIAFPEWDPYLRDFYQGIPLLCSPHVNLDLTPAAKTLAALLDHLALPSGKIAEACRTIQAQLHGKLDDAENVIALLDRDEPHSSCAGLLRYLGWVALSKHLRQTIIDFGRWRDDDKWLRSYCPTCGADAAMAQLHGVEQGRRRLLCCGRCCTRWQYGRLQCPFCGIEGDASLRVLSVQGEGGLRIDYCEGCGGYLKTYAGEGDEDLLLANWTSIHLDVLARDKQLHAFAELVYEL